MTKYVKTVPVEAVRFDGSKEMIDKYELGHRRDYEKPWFDQTTIWTLEGEMQVIKGDWLVTGVNGEHWAIKDDIFKKTYAELPVIPRAVAKYLSIYKWVGDIPLGKLLMNSFNPFLFEDTSKDWSYEEIDVIDDWLHNTDYKQHQELFARAWLDGYQVAD